MATYIGCPACARTILDKSPQCPYCEARLIPSEDGGLSVVPPPVVAPPAAEGMKRCPFCAEEIQHAAIVCRFCNRDLPHPSPPSVSLGDVVLDRGWYCTRCGYAGRRKTITKGHFLWEVVLWLLFIVPGVFYSVWRLASRYKGCPRCEAPNMVPASSPTARAARPS